MPPCFSADSATPETTSNDTTAAASICTLRIFFPPTNLSASCRTDFFRTISWRGSRATCNGGSTIGTSEYAGFDPNGASGNTAGSDFQLVAALEVENLAGLVRGRHFQPETLDDLAGKLHLFRV